MGNPRKASEKPSGASDDPDPYGADFKLFFLDALSDDSISKKLAEVLAPKNKDLVDSVQQLAQQVAST